MNINGDDDDIIMRKNMKEKLIFLNDWIWV